MTLTPTAAIAVVIAVMSAVAAWGAYLSIRSMERGPAWASDHLGGALVGGALLAVIGVVGTLTIGPIWVGAAVVYLGAVVMLLTWTLRSSLRRAAALGIDGTLAPAERRDVLARAARGLLMAAGMVFLLAVADFTVRGIPAVFDLVLVGALLAPAAAAHRSASVGTS